MRLFKRAALYGDLTVGVNIDAFVAKYKGREPQQNWQLRATTIASIPCVSRVVPNRGAGIELISFLKPDLLVIGSDWIEKDYLKQIGLTHDLMVDLDLEILFIPRTPGVSSTARREAPGETDMTDFEERLGDSPFDSNPHIGDHLGD